jgi:hypothetical protein
MFMLKWLGILPRLALEFDIEHPKGTGGAARGAATTSAHPAHQAHPATRPVDGARRLQDEDEDNNAKEPLTDFTVGVAEYARAHMISRRLVLKKHSHGVIKPTPSTW